MKGMTHTRSIKVIIVCMLVYSTTPLNADMGFFAKDTLYSKSSDDQPYRAVQTPVDLGTLTAEDFETGDFSKFPWRSSGDESWYTTRQERNSGTYSAQSGSIDDNESTTLEVTLDCASGDITFYRKVSSESNYDYLKFYIDGEEKDKWSGEQDWDEVSFRVREGTRTFEWTYSKDGSASDGDDAAWIDDIVFPFNSTSDEEGSLPLTASVEITTWQGNKRGACSFTFDDNQKTHLSHFIPKFQDLGFVGTIFLVTGDSWLSTIYDSYSQYAGLVDSGWEIGSHTVSHPHLTELSNSSLESELHDSRATLEAAFNLAPGLTLAYPFSACDTRVRNMVARYYIAARGGLGRTIAPDMSQWSGSGYSEFNLPSYAWTASEHDLNDMNSATDRAISRGEWIVEMIHGTEGDGWEPPDWELVYEPHFEYVKDRESDLWIDTFGNVYRYIAERHACSVSVQALTGGTAVVLTNESILPPTPVPLTIKIDIPNQWRSVTVTNNGNVLYGHIITESQNKYYLVDTIPTDAPKELYVYGNTSLPVGPEPPVGPTPPDVPDEPQPSEGFYMYLDDIAPNIIESGPPQEGILDYYSEDDPAAGDFCIHWTGVNQYSTISFRFFPVKDLSVLADEGFAIEFWVRCNDPGAKIDIRFVDTKTADPGDRPWRMRYTIDRNIADWNGQWNHLQIPLNAFSEMGSWDNGWFNPIGAYDWTATERFEIVPEYGDLTGIHFYFDDIRVVDPS